MALTYAWNTITAAQTDADSPLNQILMDDIRENLIHNWEYIGGRDYVAADNHDHDGVNSAVLGAAVGQAQLKTDTTHLTWNVPGWSRRTVAGGKYAFWPQIKGWTDDFNPKVRVYEGTCGNVTTTYTSYICADPVTTDKTLYIDFEYITASGEIYWVFILRDRITKKIMSMSAAPDHPCFGNGGKPTIVPHPFPEFDLTLHELIVINPSKTEIKEMQKATEVKDETKPDRYLLQVMQEDYEIDEDSDLEWPIEEVTVGLPPKWKELPFGSSIEPIKKKIPRPKDVIVRSFKKKIK